MAWDAWQEGRPWQVFFTLADVPAKAKTKPAREFLKVARAWAKSAEKLQAVRSEPLAETRHFYAYKLTGVKTLEPLLVAQDLETLEMTGGTVPDIACLAALPKLRRLRISDKARAKDLSALPTLPALRDLILGRDVEQLVGMRLALDRLRVLHTGFSDLAPIAGIEVKHLQLGAVTKTHYVNVGDDAVFPHYRNLLRLDLKTRAMTSLTPIAHLKTLRALYAARNKKLTSLDGIEGLAELEVVTLDMTSVQDLAPLAGLPKLRVLHLENTRVRDLAPLRECPALERVVVYGSPVAEDETQVDRLHEHVAEVHTDWRGVPSAHDALCAVYGTDH